MILSYDFSVVQFSLINIIHQAHFSSYREIIVYCRCINR